MPVSYSGTAITWPDSSTTTSGWTGFKNRIINGAMMIDQRNAGASVAVSDGTVTYITDRFLVYEATDGSVSGQQVSDAPTGFTNSLKITVTSADSSLAAGQIGLVQHRIEGYNTADFAFGTASATNITLSFWVKCSLTGTFGGSVNNNAENRSWLFTYTVNAANTWEYKTVTITGDTSGTWLTNNSSGIRLMWSLGSGSNYVGTSNTWDTSLKLETSGTTKLIGTNAATWQITGVQLERGSTASSFEYRDYGRELFLCQRYFFGFGNLGVSKGYIFPQPGNQPSGAGGMPIVFTPPATMRTSPDVAYNISSGNYTTGTVSGTQWRLVAPAIDSCTLSGTTVGIVGLSAPNAVGISLLYATISRQPSIIEFGSTAYLTFSAEL